MILRIAEYQVDKPHSSPAGYTEEAGEVPGIVHVPVGRAHNQHRSHVIHTAGHRQGIQTSTQRSSKIFFIFCVKLHLNKIYQDVHFVKKNIFFQFSKKIPPNKDLYCFSKVPWKN